MRLFSQVAGLCVLAAVCAVASNAVAGKERRLAWTRSAAADRGPAPRAAAAPATSPAPQVSQAPLAPHPDKPFVEIRAAEVAALHARGDVPFLDARRTSVYRQGHIAGARPFSVWESDIDDKVKAFFAEGHDPSSPIVVYCSGGECEDSHTLAQKLYLAGFDAVFVYKDGFPDWQARGLAVHTGDQP